MCTWLNESDLEECTAGRITFELAVTPIELSWAGEYYEWKPAEK